MSEWAWFQNSRLEAYRSGDFEKASLLETHCDAFDFRESEPDKTLALFSEAKALAKQLGESWWVMLFEHWIVHGTIFYKRDFRHILDAAVANVIKVRKPEFAAFPQRLRIFNDLVAIYLNIDPIGYAGEIQKALDEMETLVTPEMESSRYLLMESRVSFAMWQEQLDKAKAFSLAELNELDSEPNLHTANHHRVTNHSQLCSIAHAQENWPELDRWAHAAEESARKMKYKYPIARSILWQAVIAKINGKENQAVKLQRNAQAKFAQLNCPRCSGYYNAYATLHEQYGDLNQALHTREEQYERIKDRGQLAYECEVLIDQCRLHHALGSLSENVLQTAISAANKLLKPEWYLKKIREITES